MDDVCGILFFGLACFLVLPFIAGLAYIFLYYVCSLNSELSTVISCIAQAIDYIVILYWN